MIDAILVLGNVVAVVVIAVFTAMYSFARWEKSPDGRSVMALSLSMLALVVGRLLANLGYYEIAQWFMLFGWPAISAVMVWRTVRMWKLNRPRDPIDNSS